jgi:D-amino-acid oxidase
MSALPTAETHSPSLRMWRDLTPLPLPLKPAPSDASHILVIGGGVTGLTTAWVLLDQGKRVTIVSNEWASHAADTRLTSQIAGALWEYPPAVCGQHEGKTSLKESKRWSMLSYDCYAAIAEDPAMAAASGVQMRLANFYFPAKLEEDDVQLNKMLEIAAAGVQGFRRSMDIIEDYNIGPGQGLQDAYQIMSPIIDSDQAMQWLMKLVQDKGAKLLTETMKGDLVDTEEDLRLRFSADAIVNATGLGAEELAADKTCYPVRGALVRAVNDGTRFPRVEAALTLSADVSGQSNEIVFIVPRNDSTLLIGGIAEDNEDDMALTLDSPVIKRMRERCNEFLPALRNAELHPSYPLAVGLRPFRGGNVRVERELRRRDGAGKQFSRVVHSYGQGGAGWTLAFGCAVDVASLVDEILAGLPPRPLAEQEQSSGTPAEKLLSSSPTKHKPRIRARL